jgi:hypothetical protein
VLGVSFRRATFVFLTLVVPTCSSRAGPEDNTVSIPRALSRAGDVVTLGKPVLLEGELAGSLVLVGGGPARVSGHIRRDLILLGANATIARGAAIDGDVLAVGGDLTFEEGASPETVVRGQVRTISALEAAVLSELKTSPVLVRAVSPLLLSFRLFLLFLWLVVALLLLLAAPRVLARAASGDPSRLAFHAALGATAVLTAVLLAAFLLSVLPARAALSAGIALLAVVVVAKVFGLSTLFLVLGRRLARGLPREAVLFGDPAAVAVGLVSLGAVSLIPVVGPVVWGLASLTGIGVALASAVSREPRLLLAAS